MRRTTAVLVDCLKKNKLSLLLFILITLLNGTIFYLYNITAEPFIYSEILFAVLFLILLGLDFWKEHKSAKIREQCICNISITGTDAITDNTLRDSDYAKMIKCLTREIWRLQTEFTAKQQADDDYYTAWVHQIKTPIAVMKLHLTESTEENKALSAELFRIEQYVEMVLDYTRLESHSNDLFIKEYPLDDILREALRKFAPQFILRRLRLRYEPTERTIVTDKKWLTFILEQLISNAIKYTPQGEISISTQGNRIYITDTGIGIHPEDLPRIFEKGYTGVNGRLGQASSGLGLFLTKKASNLLAVTVTAESTPGKGSTLIITFPEPNH